MKKCAWVDDKANSVRIYLIKDESSGEIAAYFGLKAGMVADSSNGMPSLKTRQRIMKEFGVKNLPEIIPGFEISHFAVNDDYRRHASTNGKPIRGLGEFFYLAFIYQMIEDVT